MSCSTASQDLSLRSCNRPHWSGTRYEDVRMILTSSARSFSLSPLFSFWGHLTAWSCDRVWPYVRQPWLCRDGVGGDVCEIPARSEWTDFPWEAVNWELGQSRQVGQCESEGGSGGFVANSTAGWGMRNERESVKNVWSIALQWFQAGEIVVSNDEVRWGDGESSVLRRRESNWGKGQKLRRNGSVTIRLPEERRTKTSGQGRKVPDGKVVVGGVTKMSRSAMGCLRRPRRPGFRTPAAGRPMFAQVQPSHHWPPLIHSLAYKNRFDGLDKDQPGTLKHTLTPPFFSLMHADTR